MSVVITIVMEGRSAKAFEALDKIGEDVKVKALRNGNPVMLHKANIVVGDILLLENGDIVPADGRLLESRGLSTDEAALTGESLPVLKDAEIVFTDEKTPLAERRNMLYSGTYVTEGSCKMVVTAVGDKTEFGKIARALTSVDSGTTPLQEKLGRLGKRVAVFGVSASALVFIVQIIRFWQDGALAIGEIAEAFLGSVVLIVASVPEGLPTVVAVTLALNVIKMAREHALVKKMIACETVGCVNIICSDKTGTLTENRMTVANDITNTSAYENICINSTADLGENDLFIGNSTECAMLVAAKKSGYDYKQARQGANVTYVYPFTSVKKGMTTVVKTATGYTAYTKGSPEKVLKLCEMTPLAREEAEAQIMAYQEKAHRVIGFAHRTFSEKPADDEEVIEQHMTFDGFVAIADPLRKEVYDAASQCKEAGIAIKMLTGDNIITARAIANEIGLLDNGLIAVEARDLEELSDEELSERINSIGVIARSTPSMKMRVVQLLKDQGKVVAVTGDGVNDAPALKNADVGIAMGITGTDVSKEASEIVLLNDSFATIVHAVRWGRGIYENFRRFISFQLTANVSALTTVLIAVLFGMGKPFTALQILWVNIIMDGPPAITLGLEPVRADIMQSSPISRNENIISMPLLIRIALMGLYIAAISLLQFATDFLGVGYVKMPSAMFALFSILQVFNAFNCRVLTADSIFKTFFANKVLIVVMAITLVAQVLIIQFAGIVFGTVALPFIVWVQIFALALTVVIVPEIIKVFMRLFRRSEKRA